MIDGDENEDHVLDDAASNDVGEETVAEKAGDGPEGDADEGVSPEQGLEELKKSLAAQKKALEDERRMRSEAERRAYQASVSAQNSQKEAKTAQYYQFKSAISEFEARERQMMQELADAKSMGDFQREVELQRALLETVQDLNSFKQAHDRLDYELRQPVQPVAPPVEDPIEAWASKVSPKSAQWLRSNREFLESHPKMNDILAASHMKATAYGHGVDTPEYFAFIENDIGMNRKPARRQVEEDYEDDEDDGVMSVASAPSPRRAPPPPPAPVSRGGNRKGTIHLTKEEREVAAFSGLTEEQYYANKLKEKKRASR